MASASYAGPVAVQDQPEPPAIDLATKPSQNGASPAAKPAHLMTSAAPKDESDDEYDTLSLYEDILDDTDPPDYSQMGPDSCTAEEARAIRQRLHEVGTGPFVFEYITNGKYSAQKLLTAFGVRVPMYMAGREDETFYPLLGMAIQKELAKRARITAYNNIDHAAKLLKERENIMVITGAGISTSLGIPDFRSKNTGFYSKLREKGFEAPEEVFDIRNFDLDPSHFYSLAGDILPDMKKWSPTHEFIRMLQDKGKLLTNYTQNIDNLEACAGIKSEKIIQCHGSWATATCRKCSYKVPGEQIFADIREKKPSQCPMCVQNLATQKPGRKRKRSSDSHKKRRQGGDDDSDSDGAYDIPQPGIMKPDITFFGEPLPQNFFDRLKQEDKTKVDLVIVIGTSMKVAPVSEIPNYLPRNVPQIYISRDPIHHINFDINLLGDCDTIVGELARRAGWDLKHKMLPENQKVVVTPSQDDEATYRVKVRRAVVPDVENGANAS